MVRCLCEGGNPVKAIPWLDRLRQYYENRSTDDHLLYTGGLAVFRQVVEAIEDVARGAGPAFQAKAWIESFQKTWTRTATPLWMN